MIVNPKGTFSKGVYFLLYGKVHLIGTVAHSQKGFPFRKMCPGSFFGESIFLGEASQFEIV